MAAAVFLSAKGKQRAGNRPAMHIEGVADRPEIVAVAQAAYHIHHVKAHRSGTDIRAPGLVLPAHRNAGATVGLVFATAGAGNFTAGPPVWRIATVAVR